MLRLCKTLLSAFPRFCTMEIHTFSLYNFDGKLFFLQGKKKQFNSHCALSNKQREAIETKIFISNELLIGTPDHTQRFF